ncbi:MAG: NINE protein [Planctomycetes bacterium]|nr:NINE protein [Planctomycetota bacterium]
MLIAGRVAREDLAWIEGAPDWKPLGSILGVVDLPPLPEQRDPVSGDVVSDRLVLPAFLLAFFVGVFGVHRFYVGKTGSGVVMLLLTLTVVGLFVTGIWALVDWIIIVCGGFRDSEGRLIRRWT